MSNTQNSTTGDDTRRLYDKLDEIVKAVGDLDKSVALINQANATREGQQLALGTRLGSLEESQRRDDLWKARLRGTWVPIGAALTFIIGILGAVLHDYLKEIFHATAVAITHIITSLA